MQASVRPNGFGQMMRHGCSESDFLVFWRGEETRSPRPKGISNFPKRRETIETATPQWDGRTAEPPGPRLYMELSTWVVSSTNIGPSGLNAILPDHESVGRVQ